MGVKKTFEQTVGSLPQGAPELPRAEPTQIVPAPPARALRATPGKKKFQKPEPWMGEVFANLLRQGHTRASAAGTMGVPYSRIKIWLDAGEAEDCEDPDLLDFYDKASRATSEAVTEALGYLKMQAMLNPKAAVEYLKAISPSHNPARKIEIEDKTPQKVTVDFTGWTDAEIEQYRALEAKRLGG